MESVDKGPHCLCSEMENALKCRNPNRIFSRCPPLTLASTITCNTLELDTNLMQFRNKPLTHFITSRKILEKIIYLKFNYFSNFSTTKYNTQLPSPRSPSIYPTSNSQFSDSTLHRYLRCLKDISEPRSLCKWPNSLTSS